MNERTRPLHMRPTGDSRLKDVHGLKVKGWKKIINENGNNKKSWDNNIYIKQNRL